MFNIAIAIAVAGGPAVTATINGVAAAGRRMGDTVGTGAARAKDALTGVQSKAQAAKNSLASINSVSFGGVLGKLEGLSGRLKEAGDAAGEKFGEVRNLGLGLMGASAAGAYMIGKGMQGGVQKESQLKSIEALSGSRAKADEIYKTTDEMSTESVANLPELVGAAKTLTAAKMFDKRTLVAADDLAAVKRDEGANPQDVARAMARLKSGDFGEAFERFRDFGISRPDLEAKGLKFSKSGEFQGTADEAISAVVAVIEERFGGLSEKLATETTEGALSNLGDAFGRLTTSLSEELTPTVTVVARWVTGATTALNNMSPGMKKFIAWGAVITVVILGVVGAGLVLGATLGQAMVMMGILTGVVAVNTVAHEAEAAATGAAAGAAGVATLSFGALAVAIGAALLPLALLGIALVGLGLIAKKYYDELQKPTESAGSKMETDRRKAAGTDTAEGETRKIKEIGGRLDTVLKDPKSGLLKRMEAYGKARDEFNEAGLTDAAIQMEQERQKIARSPQGQALLEREAARRSERGEESAGARKLREYQREQAAKGQSDQGAKVGANGEIEAPPPQMTKNADGTMTVKFQDLKIDQSKVERDAKAYADKTAA